MWVCFTLGFVNCQPKEKHYSFVKEDLNIIHNAEELAPFFTTLNTFNKKQINILHIGDSHLQANYITGVLRDKFQAMFGNAGRGLIVPYQLAGTNSPEDILSLSNITWEGKRNCKPLLPQANGIGGITIESKDSTATFFFRLPEKYAFTKMTLFFENDGKIFDLSAKDLANGQIIEVKKYLSPSDPNVAILSFQKPTTEVEISSSKTDPAQTHTTILGINTENDQKGLIYHSIGVNGAEYFHYDTSRYFNEETPFLKPDIIIISLGTNEAYRRNKDFKEDLIKEQINSFITNLKKYNPGVPFLITTPANAYREKVQNPNIKTMRDILVSYCKENNLAYWDLQEITGSAANWKTNNLFSKDLLHYNKEGYQLQGNLLFKAILNSYNNYVAGH